MKTIKERAIEYDAICRFCDNGLAFIAGAKSEHEELTRWNEPKEPPKEGVMVLVKRTPDSLLPYDLAHYDGSCWVDSWCGVTDLGGKIIGWREIHE